MLRMLVDKHEWIDYSLYISKIEGIAKKRDEQKRGFKSSKLWTANKSTHYYGTCGEMVVSLQTGLEIDEKLRINGDPGFDFVYNGNCYDVKAATFYRSPDIKEFLDKKLVADFYILVGLNSYKNLGYIAGWCSKQQLLNADTRDYGNGQMRSISYRFLARTNQLGLPVELKRKE